MTPRPRSNLACIRIELHIPGEPISKGRPRFARGRAYTPQRTRDAEDYVRRQWEYAGKPRIPDGTFFRMFILATFAEPKRRAFPFPPRPDADNIAKLVMDALNGHAFYDDSRCYLLSVEKRYGNTPGTDVAIVA